MKPLAICILLTAVIVGCANLRDKPYSFTELVMKPGESITAETPGGTITVKADDELTRTYTWEGASRSARLWPRPKRWYGSLGAYFPGNGEHWREHHGITRGVLGEGQQHFQTLGEAIAWIQTPWHQPRSVYRDDGLFVLFDKTTERRQLGVDVIQIYIRGRKPTSLPGSQNHKIEVCRAVTNAVHTSRSNSSFAKLSIVGFLDVNPPQRFSAIR